ncbi:MAG: Holliday junction branch migration protein RuvA [Verrucomicrobiaceae bacterium]|nr:Holliday junction branch migration protein RuvA [Verrucomicrobiaceae bacterium]
MITYLSGELVESLPNQITLDVNGVGYQVLIPLSTYDVLGHQKGRIKILTHLHVREDAHILYGFATAAERDLFRLLIQRVSGVGPKIALAVLSGVSVDEFQAAVVRGDVECISQVKGLGKKTTERIVLELKDKVGVVEAWGHASGGEATQESVFNDGLLALINLGYKQTEANKAIALLRKSGEFSGDSTVDEIIRAGLRILN